MAHGFTPTFREAVSGNGLITTFPDAAEALTPDDDVVFDQPSVVWINETGVDVVVEPWAGGATITWTAETVGPIPFRVRRVLDTGTTATALLRIYGRE